jgi:hypothetical protein
MAIMENKLMDGAFKIVDSCLGVQKNESVLIITDYQTQNTVAEALKEAAFSLGAQVSVLTVEPGKMPGERTHSRNEGRHVAGGCHHCRHRKDHHAFRSGDRRLQQRGASFYPDGV